MALADVGFWIVGVVIFGALGVGLFLTSRVESRRRDLAPDQERADGVHEEPPFDQEEARTRRRWL